MTLKSLLLGAAAGVAAIGSAHAADLPMTKGEAVEYVKVCSAFGPGFFYIPGSDTCLKIGGEVRADYRGFGGDHGWSVNSSGRIVNGRSRNDDRSAFNTQARIWFDARTQTDWGLLRSFFQINADSHPISFQGRGHVYNGNTFGINKAYIQFGGLTAGYAHSFFGFYDNEYGDTIWAPYYAEGNTVNLLAYTAQFGGGFSATLSIEDGRDHNYSSFGLGYGSVVAPWSSADSVARLRGGQIVPDVVAQLRFDQSWGSIAVQAAGHQTRSGNGTGRLLDPNGNILSTFDYPNKSKYGYAVGGTALIKLPFIDGGHFVVEGQYADGALDYLGANNDTLAGGGPGDLFVSRFTTAGGVTTVNSFKTAKGWSIVAELGGNITPALNANLVGSYIDTKSKNFLGLSSADFQAYTIAGNVAYTIVKGLTISGEVAYTHNKWGNVITAFDPATGVATTQNAKQNVWQAGVRLKRVF